MSKLIEEEPGRQQTAREMREMTVSEISGDMKRLVEGAFSYVRVRAEIGRVSRPASGHVYLALKDDRAMLSGVIWKGVAARLQTRPEEGMEIIATGHLTTFSGQSKYQMVVENLLLAGAGALMAVLEKRKTALAAEGLFNADRKQKIPFLPEHIGIITSPSGAVIRDILHRLRDRFPRPATIWPVAVQGTSSAHEIARAIEGFNAFSKDSKSLPRPDLIIVARGGGSLEDLWSFNEEIVVRAAANSTIPIISAIGHEIDTTLLDFVADMRAPTPTAAAEFCVPVRLELVNTLKGINARLSHALKGRIKDRRQRLNDLSRALPRPSNFLANAAQRLDLLVPRLPNGLKALTRTHRIGFEKIAALIRPQFLTAQMANARTAQIDISVRLDALSKRVIETRRDSLAQLGRLHKNLSYRATLTRGYAVVRDGERLLANAEAAKNTESFEIEFSDGRIKTRRAAQLPPLRQTPLGGLSLDTADKNED